MNIGLSPRAYTIENYTRTVCPACFADAPRRSDEAGVWKDGMLVSHDGSIWLRRFCAEHGETESLYEEDADLWRARTGWSTPTLQITPDRAGNYAGFPDGYREGLPASHGQHTCILLLNITDRCNYGCVTCYATARPPGTPVPREERPTIEDIVHTVQTVIAREGGKLGVLMLSGGEPTVRDDIGPILERLAPLPITRIVLNTNGRRIARDDRFVQLLAGFRDRIEIYLQFDGLRAETHLALRAEDVREEKRTALRKLAAAEIWTTLVMAVARGVNEDEVGAVLKMGLEMPRCAGLMIQPVFGSGRHAGFDGGNRTTPTGILRRLAQQTDGLVRAEDFIPLPCSHADCCDITYLLRDARGRWVSVPKLVGRDELRRWIHLVSNTISFDAVSTPLSQMIREGVLQRVFSEQQSVRAPALALDLARLCDCVPGVSQLLGGLQELLAKRKDAADRAAERTFRVTVKMFMDAHTLHEARLRQCCVHTGTFEADPRRFSFCWRWLFADAGDVMPAVPAEAGFVALSELGGP